MAPRTKPRLTSWRVFRNMSEELSSRLRDTAMFACEHARHRSLKARNEIAGPCASPERRCVEVKCYRYIVKNFPPVRREAVIGRGGAFRAHANVMQCSSSPAPAQPYTLKAYAIKIIVVLSPRYPWRWHRFHAAAAHRLLRAAHNERIYVTGSGAQARSAPSPPARLRTGSPARATPCSALCRRVSKELYWAPASSHASLSAFSTMDEPYGAATVV